MSRAVEQRSVAFTGDGAGEGELSWGQKENWATIQAGMNVTGTWLPLGGVKPLPPGTSIEEIADELRFLLSRYQPLRTLVRSDAAGRPVQVVHGSGEIILEVVDAGDADPGEVAEEVCERYRTTRLDFTAEWPLRMGVIRSRGELTHMAVLMSHFATDAAGAAVMLTEVVTRPSAPVAGMQPLAQAAWQQSPAGQRQNAAALRYWEEILRTIDPRRFDDRRVDQQRVDQQRAKHQQSAHQPRYWHGEFTSPALPPAVRAIARDTGLGASTVFLALFAVALSEVTGITPTVVRPIVGNRFRPGLAEVVCTVAQAGVCVLDVAGVSFDEALRRAQRSVNSAYKYAYFDHEDMVALKARIALERGVDPDIRCFINDRHMPDGPQETGPIPTLELIRDAATPSEFRWITGQDSPSFEQLFVHVDDAPDAAEISLHLDSRSVSLADAEALARAMEATATASAVDRLRAALNPSR